MLIHTGERQMYIHWLCPIQCDMERVMGIRVLKYLPFCQYTLMKISGMLNWCQTAVWLTQLFDNIFITTLIVCMPARYANWFHRVHQIRNPRTDGVCNQHWQNTYRSHLSLFQYKRKTTRMHALCDFAAIRESAEREFTMCYCVPPYYFQRIFESSPKQSPTQTLALSSNIFRTLNAFALWCSVYLWHRSLSYARNEWKTCLTTLTSYANSFVN